MHCGKKRVARLMRERGINAKSNRRKVKTTESQHDNPVAPHLLKRDFTGFSAQYQTGSRHHWNWDSRRMVLPGCHRGYLLPIGGWLGDEQGARRAIGHQGGTDGDHRARGQEPSSCIIAREEVSRRARAISHGFKKLEDKSV